MSELKLIVGLGNPGANYEYTRHNIGFLALKQLTEQFKLRVSPSLICKGLTAEGEIAGKDCCFLFPMTFMNNSGVAVRSLLNKKEIDPGNILVVCDDFNLAFDQLRLRRGGSDGGHNGLSSIIYHLESESFARIRVGIGAPKGKQDPADFVLEEFDKKEKEYLDFLIQDTVDCCVAWITTEDIEQVMSQFNKRKGNG